MENFQLTEELRGWRPGILHTCLPALLRTGKWPVSCGRFCHPDCIIFKADAKLYRLYFFYNTWTLLRNKNHIFTQKILTFEHCLFFDRFVTILYSFLIHRIFLLLILIWNHYRFMGSFKMRMDVPFTWFPCGTVVHDHSTVSELVPWLSTELVRILAVSDVLCVCSVPFVCTVCSM